MHSPVTVTSWKTPSSAHHKNGPSQHQSHQHNSGLTTSIIATPISTPLHRSNSTTSLPRETPPAIIRPSLATSSFRVIADTSPLAQRSTKPHFQGKSRTRTATAIPVVATRVPNSELIAALRHSSSSDDACLAEELTAITLNSTPTHPVPAEPTLMKYSPLVLRRGVMSPPMSPKPKPKSHKFRTLGQSLDSDDSFLESTVSPVPSTAVPLTVAPIKPTAKCLTPTTSMFGSVRAAFGFGPKKKDKDTSSAASSMKEDVKGSLSTNTTPLAVHHYQPSKSLVEEIAAKASDKALKNAKNIQDHAKKPSQYSTGNYKVHTRPPPPPLKPPGGKLILIPPPASNRSLRSKPSVGTTNAGSPSSVNQDDEESAPTTSELLENCERIRQRVAALTDNKHTSVLMQSVTEDVDEFGRHCNRYADLLAPGRKFKFREMLVNVANSSERLKTGSARDYELSADGLSKSLRDVDGMLKRTVTS